MSSFNQGVPGPATLINSSNCIVLGNTTSGTALTVQQLGAGAVMNVATSTGSSALFVSSTGQVGVGTASPAYALDVLGSARVNMGTSNVIIGAGQGVGQGGLYMFPQSSIAGSSWNLGCGLQGSYANAITFVSGTNVGIGTTNPGYTLQVNGTMAATYASSGAGSYVFGVSTDYRAMMTLNHATGINLWAANQDVGDGDRTLSIQTSDSGSASGQQVTMTLQLSTQGTRCGLDFKVARDGASSQNPLYTITQFTGTVRDLYYLSSTKAYFPVQSVGIGITNPARHFTIVDGGSSPMLIDQTNSSIADTTILIRKAITTNLTGDYFVNFQTNATYDGNGNYVSGAVQRFIIRDDGYINSASLGGGATTLSVDAGGGIIRTPSDARLKSNIITITYGLNIANALRPVFYTWNEPERLGSGRQIGMIAQEVADLVPEAVSAGTDENKTLSLDYQKLVPVLTKAIQELSTENTALKQSLATATARLDSLEARLSAAGL